MTALLLAATLALAAPELPAPTPVAPPPGGKWTSIFNGRNLDGWVVKVNHHPLGENWRDTFVVKDGTLRASYANYDRFKDEFAHLIYKKPLSSFRIRLEYRFLGDSPPGAPAWAIRNSGVMIHGEAPEAMGLDQSYPISVEAQLLGGKAGETRPTGNVCTPGTTVSIDGALLLAHCRNSSAKTYPDGQWVRFEVEVHGSKVVRQYVDGELVMTYSDLKLAPAEYKGLNAPAVDLIPKGSGPLDRGYISLQGESAPVEFRKIELMELPE